MGRLDSLLCEIRKLTRGFLGNKKDERAAARAFRDLSSLMLRHTILAKDVDVGFYSGEASDIFTLGGRPLPTTPLRIRNGRFLAYSVQLFLDGDTGRLKVSKSRYQYQLDEQGDQWAFRYEYLRDPKNKHPAAHLHVRGKLEESCIGSGALLERIHFPTDRVSIEAVIRLLIDHFGVETVDSAPIWRPALLESEKQFRAIAHQPLNEAQGRD